MPERTEGAGEVQEEPLETVETTEEIITTEEVPEESSDEPKTESVKDTVKRALEEEKAKGDGGGGAPEGIAGGEEDKGTQKPVKQRVKKVKDVGPEFDAELYPPERLKAHEKELFNKLPAPLKKAWHRTIKDLEGITTRDAQEYKKASAEARGVVEAVQPFAASFAERGFTVPAAVAALCAANAKLTNPETAVKAFIDLGRDIGIDFEQIGAIARGEAPDGNGRAPAALDPEIKTLREQVNALLSERQRAEQSQIEQSAASIVAEMAAVRDEKDQFGRYRYPEMHEEGFFAKVKPLVSALRGNAPDLSYGEALKRAYSAVTGKPTAASAQLNQTSLPAKETTPNRALTAAVSVRGRTAPQMAGMAMPENIPDSVRETTRLALEQLRRGVA